MAAKSDQAEAVPEPVVSEETLLKQKLEEEAVPEPVVSEETLLKQKLEEEARKCKRQLWVEYQLQKFPWLSTAFLTEVLPKSSSWFVPKRVWEKEACTARRVLRLLSNLRFGVKLHQLSAADKGGA